MGGQHTGLELNAHGRVELVPVGLGIETHHAHRPGIGGTQADGALDGGRLAGAVGSQDAEDLACLNGEADVVHRHGGSVRLAEVIDLDDRHGPGYPGWARAIILPDRTSF